MSEMMQSSTEIHRNRNGEYIGKLVVSARESMIRVSVRQHYRFNVIAWRDV